MLISIGMMVKNESKYLRKCLESLQPIRDVVSSELIIVDTGSTDNTVEIAKEFTDKVYFYEWHNNFSEIRNIVINHCSGEWIFIIDGDEILEKSEYIIDFFKSEEYKRWNTVCLVAKSFTTFEFDRDYSLLMTPRIFKNDGDFHYEGSVHNQPIYKTPLYAIDSQLLHYGYISNDKELMERKFNRTSKILKEELKKNPKNVYYIFQLSISYSMHGDLEKGLEEAVKAYKIIKCDKLDEELYKYVFIHLAQMYILNLKYEEAEKICLEALGEDSIYIDLYYYLADAETSLYKNELAIKNYEIYLEKLKNYGASKMSKDISASHNTLGKYEYAYINLGILYSRIGIYEKAVEYINMIENDKTIDEYMANIITVFLNTNKIVDLRNFYDSKILIKYKHLEEKFLITLEIKIRMFSNKKREEIHKSFSKGSSDYALLNKLRLHQNEEKIDEAVLENILLSDFNQLPLFYSDVIYLMMKRKYSLEKIFDTINDNKLEAFLEYLNSIHTDLGETIYEYLDVNKSIKYDLSQICHNKILEEHALKSKNIKEENYKNIFCRYLKDGFEYINKIYNPDVIENGEVNRLKSDEDCFLLILYIAEKSKDNRLQYIKSLRKALERCNYMKNGIELLLNETKEDFNREENEMESYKKKVKKAISELIDNGKLDDAKELIKQYDGIIEEDVEIYSMKAVIAIIENKIDEAENILKKGFILEKNNFDLLYNMGYLCEKNDRTYEAIRFYNIAKEVCKDSSIIEQLEKSICSIKNEKKYEVIIYGSDITDDCIKVLLSIGNTISIIKNKELKIKKDINIPIIDITQIKNYKYDFIIILEKEEFKANKCINKLIVNGVDKKNIYDYYRHNYNFCIEGFDYKFDEIIKKNKVELLITGLSYAETAIDSNYFNLSSFNFALSSQDLFYDYNITKYLLNLGSVSSSLKYVIISLAYYSFDYDLSKSNEAARTHRYYECLGTTHNYLKSLDIDIIHSLYKKTNYKKEYYDMTVAKANTKMYDKNAENQEYIAKHHAAMNHPITVMENKKIFEEYLELLKSKNIKPIVVVCPTSKYHHTYFEDGLLKSRFYNILNEFKKYYNFQILDYFNSDLFEDNDFWDYSHLNKNGAEKFTKLLNENINW